MGIFYIIGLVVVVLAVFGYFRLVSNAVRTLIAERLLERHGTAWWSEKVPGKTGGSSPERGQESSWLEEGQKQDPLGFVQFASGDAK